MTERNAIIELLYELKAKPEQGWTQLDAQSAELEVLYLLYALVKALKPKRILETGTHLGYSAIFMGQALRENFFGDIDTIEIQARTAERASLLVRSLGLEAIVHVRDGDAAKWWPAYSGTRYDMAFFDTEPELRILEYRRFSEVLSSNALVCFHDTRLSEPLYKDVTEERSLRAVLIPTARGIAICQKRF